MSVYSTLSCRDAPQRFAAYQFSKCIHITLSYIFSLHLMQKLELPSRNSLLSMPETDKKNIGWLSQKDVSLARGHTNAHNTFHFMVLLYLQTYLNIPFISLKLMPTAHRAGRVLICIYWNSVFELVIWKRGYDLNALEFEEIIYLPAGLRESGIYVNFSPAWLTGTFSLTYANNDNSDLSRPDSAVIHESHSNGKHQIIKRESF